MARFRLVLMNTIITKLMAGFRFKNMPPTKMGATHPMVGMTICRASFWEPLLLPKPGCR